MTHAAKIIVGMSISGPVDVEALGLMEKTHGHVKVEIHYEDFTAGLLLGTLLMLAAVYLCYWVYSKVVEATDTSCASEDVFVLSLIHI